MLEEEMKIRVPASMKADFNKLAAARITSEAALARQAFIEYLKAHQGELDQLRETSAPVPAPAPPTKPVTYAKSGLKKDTQRKILDTVKKGVKAPPVPPQPK